MSRAAVTLAAALTAALAACGGDGGTSSRDYTDTGCPAPVAAPGWEQFACDRGRGQSPRYVSVPSCAQELGLVAAMPQVATIDSTSPNYAMCRTARVSVVTIDDVSRSTYFTR